MRLFWKSIIINIFVLSCLLSFLLYFFAINNSFVFAQIQPDAFVVTVEPSSFDINTPVDITIKAVKANGDVVKDYDWDVFIDIEWWLDITDYTVPSDQLYTFIPQDQWSKTFSKWLSIKKAGTFTVVVSDVSQDSIKWEKTIIVWAKASASDDLKKITITSPIKWGTEKNEILEVIWWSIDLPNSPLELYLNNQLVYQNTTDSNWEFVAYLSWLQKWENNLQAKVVDASNTILWESTIITFNYDSLVDWTFNSIQVLPGNTIKAWDKPIFNVSTSDDVTSVTLNLSNWRSAPMDLQSAWNFTKEMMVDTQGKIDVSLDIIVAGQKKSYPNVTRLIVEKWTKIWKVRIFSDSVYKNKLTITWDVEWGDSPRYNVLFGKASNELNQSETVTKKELILQDLDIWQIYYFKIVPLDVNWKELWWASDVIQFKVGEGDWSTCTVQWIQVNDVQVWNNHYLVRSWVSNIEKYIIYRSDFSETDVSKMQKVGETFDTRFEYPFNKSAKQDKFSYYAIQAICKDGKAIVMNDIKRVKTGPVDNILLFISITAFLYSSYRLYLFNKE